MQRWIQKQFLASGTWVAPAGIVVAFIQGCGGGGGGDTANATIRGHGGAAAMFSCVAVQITPNTSYSITIGAGGAANADGVDTTFGSLAVFKAGGHSRANNPTASLGASFLQPFICRDNQGALGNAANSRQLFGASGGLPPDQFAPAGMAGLGGSGGFGAGGQGATFDMGGAVAAASNTGAGGGGGGTNGVAYSGGAAGGSGRLTVFWLE